METLSGSYGKVTLNADRAVKESKCYESDGRMILPNFREAILCQSVISRIPNSIGIKSVSCCGTNIGSSSFFLEMERGEETLEKYILRTPFEMRMKVISSVLTSLAMSLYEMHGRGIVHGDLKPSNVVICGSCNGVVNVKIIDYGSSRLYKRATPAKAYNLQDNECTYQFAPPEAFEYVQSSPATDAYSLGMLAYFMIYKKIIINDVSEWRMFRDRHRLGAIAAHFAIYKCPDNVDPQLFNFIMQFLEHDVGKRLTVSEYLFANDAPHYIINPEIRVLDPPTKMPNWSPEAVDRIFRRCGDDFASATVAVNVAMRYCAFLGKKLESVELDACASIALTVLSILPSYGSYAFQAGGGILWRVILDILLVLQFDIVSYTCDCILVEERGFVPDEIDYTHLQEMIKVSNGSARGIAEAYARTKAPISKKPMPEPIQLAAMKQRRTSEGDAELQPPPAPSSP